MRHERMDIKYAEIISKMKNWNTNYHERNHNVDKLNDTILSHGKCLIVMLMVNKLPVPSTVAPFVGDSLILSWDLEDSILSIDMRNADAILTACKANDFREKTIENERYDLNIVSQSVNLLNRLQGLLTKQ